MKSHRPGIMLVILENQQSLNILGNQNAPFLTSLAQDYPIATTYFGRTHPSLPNYMELWSGSTYGVTDDGPPTSHSFTGDTLGAQLDAAGLDWSGYFGSLGPGEDPTLDGPVVDGQVVTDASGAALYQVKHNPIVYFSGWPAGKVRPFAHLDDLPGGLDPLDFCLVVPDMADNMHDPVGSTHKDHQAVQDGDRWIRALVEAVQPTGWWQRGGCILITWDEAYNGSGQPVPGGTGDPPTDGGPILLYLVSRAFRRARPGEFGLGGDTNWDHPLTHAGLLRSIERYFELPLLGDAANTTYGDIGDVLISAASSLGR